MAIETIWGKVTNRPAIESLIASLKALQIDGSLYLGYPILASADSNVTVEALLVSQNPGLIAFNFPLQDKSIVDIKDMQDKLGFAIDANLSRHNTLRRKRRIGITPNIISYFVDLSEDLKLNDDEYLFADKKTLTDCFVKCKSVSASLIRPLHAAIQRVITIKPRKKRNNVVKHNSCGATLKTIESEIANLDQWQKKAAIETPEGPQRVRGLAGSGKTIVLALKAAYLHAQHPEWNIAVTFNTRSLSQQFTDLIERFSIEHSGDKPDWEKLQIIHAWGSASSPGIYSKIAMAIDLVPMDYVSASQKFGRNMAFDGACAETLVSIKNSPVEIFDAILIDEAQDFPVSFFQLVYKATKSPKRIIWAYDELQNLSNSAMLSVNEVFDSNISLNNELNGPQQDVILPICYRNTPWTLALAHALGFGLYRTGGMVQLFDELDLWQDIGYQVVSGSLAFDSNVTLKRRDDSYPAFFKELLRPDNAIVVKKFDSEIQQYEWIAKEIEKNIKEDELDPDDILIVLPDAYSATQKYPAILNILSQHKIDSHLAGVSTRRDVFTVSGSVTVASIYRAKGNEAAMVYIVNSDYCVGNIEMIKKRNILFTAITRSRAWVRICGVDSGMDILMKEIKSIQDSAYQLAFHIPTQEELSHMRLINRDRSSEEKAKVLKAQKNIRELTRAIEEGNVLPEDLPKLKELMRKILESDG